MLDKLRDRTRWEVPSHVTPAQAHGGVVLEEEFVVSVAQLVR
jgi:hypothetical protein